MKKWLSVKSLGGIGLALALCLSGCQTAAPPAATAPGNQIPLKSDSGRAYPAYEREEDIPWYSESELNGMAVGASYSIGYQGDTLAELVADSDIVVIGTVGRKQEGTVGRAVVTYTLIEVEQVLKGPEQDQVYIQTYGSPVSWAQTQTLAAQGSAQGLAMNPLTYAAYGSRVLVFGFYHKIEDDPQKYIGDVPVYGPQGMFQGVYGVAEDGSVDLLQQRAGFDTFTTPLVADVLRQLPNLTAARQRVEQLVR
ncbi:MAG: hypothetical protein ACOYJA_11795 [Christensenellales bacterium]|jgi:hypothetical protein